MPPGRTTIWTTTTAAGSRTTQHVTGASDTRVLIEDTVVLIEYSPGREQIMMGES
jgi:hypothetical protein